MSHYPVLCVGGCSFSDYTKIETPYGLSLSDKLKVDYIHEGAGCGSNWRIWRKIVGYILNGQIKKGDVLVIQYTTPERREFWSQENGVANLKKIQLREKYEGEGGGNILRFKIDNHNFTKGKEPEFIKMYEENFLNHHFEFEVFLTQNAMFQSFLKEREINTVFLISPYYDGHDLTDHFRETALDIRDFCSNVEEYGLEKIYETSYHLNQRGHDELSNLLNEHISSLNYL